MNPLRIAIAGASGRMGRMLVEAVLNDSEVVLAAAFDRAGTPFIGRDAGELVGSACGVVITDAARAAIASADCVIDFTRPEGTLVHLGIARELGKAMVIGTTGFSAAEKDVIAAAAQDVPVVFAPNMAVGVNAVFKLLEVAARILDEGYDVEVIEAHHRFKVDAPSGTALRMGEVVARELGRNLEECAIYGREGVTGERKSETIGFSTIRGGDVVGDHTVLFAGIGERIEITHKSGSRMPYALGSVRAARFLAGRKSGLFDMQDVLGLR
ncbi:4-hydroxy-tetrahydrodipicolinate reductase [Aromatoleum toluvorans]|uniref:4-hydroxy-tetrahydrodipicolinate reductase n=1 Tax=Aromatoleum toluvorans TaxID=92002 RepID=A0ABX1PZ08_9RHOO|nr:4-hydroxy-tetrahydrodipicolinate reductase [Aromatoleum toluvorans]NMG43475.1 4-hydroxy-tetrahydrodipicolinate reductase [Aromatoleum toluvorans]